MASLMKLRTFIKPLTSKNPGIICNLVRTKYIHPDDWKPGPYPKTEEERRKAAEKYGLSPEEYEPYPDDGDGIGDYPKLPAIGRAMRDPYYPWDDPTHRRNFHEPIHDHDNIMGEDRCDVGEKFPVSRKYAYTAFFSLIGSLAFLIWLSEPFIRYHPVMPKQYAKPGVVHYTFEPAH